MYVLIRYCAGREECCSAAALNGHASWHRLSEHGCMAVKGLQGRRISSVQCVYQNLYVCSIMCQAPSQALGVLSSEMVET